MSRVALVTGTSSGIGQATALGLAARGWLVGATLRDERGSEPLLQEGCDLLTCDVTRPEQCQRAVDSLIKRHGRLDALVANAGVGLFGCFEDLDDDQIRAVFDVNLFGVMNCARAALPALRESRGRLVIVSSVAGRRAAPGSSAYNASKFAVEGWAEALAYEVEPFGVTVVLVEPGPTQSAFFDQRQDGSRVGTGPYGPITERLRTLSSAVRDRAVPVQTIANTIVEALETEAPRLRLAPGLRNRAEITAARVLPTAIFRGLARQKIRLPPVEK